MNTTQLDTSLEALELSISQIQWQALNDLAHRGLKFPKEFLGKNRKNELSLPYSLNALLKENGFSEKDGKELHYQLYMNESSAIEAKKIRSQKIELILRNVMNNQVSPDLLKVNWKGLSELADHGAIPDGFGLNANNTSEYSATILMLADRIQKTTKDIDDLLSNNAEKKVVGDYIDSLIYWRATGMKNAPEKPKISTNLLELAYTLAFKNYSDYSFPLRQKNFMDWINGKARSLDYVYDQIGIINLPLQKFLEHPIECYESFYNAFQLGIELGIDPEVLNRNFAILASQAVIDESIMGPFLLIKESGGVIYQSGTLQKLLNTAVERGASQSCGDAIQSDIDRLKEIEDSKKKSAQMSK